MFIKHYIFRFFQDGGRQPSCILKSSKFLLKLLVRFVGPICVIMPNVVPIGQTVAEISRFFNFSGRRPPQSWILNFIFVTV